MKKKGRIREVTSDALARYWSKAKVERHKEVMRQKSLMKVERKPPAKVEKQQVRWTTVAPTKKEINWNTKTRTMLAGKQPILKSWKKRKTIWGTHSNGYVYRRQSKGVYGWVHDPKLFQNHHSHEEAVQPVFIEAIDNTMRPRPGQLRTVFERVFVDDEKCRSHEIMVVWGKDRDGQWAVYVPPQKVSRASVQIDGAEAMAPFGTWKVYGDMHSHPWQGLPSASGTDMADMKKKTGLYAIVSSRGEVQWYAAIDGQVVVADVWDLKEWEPEVIPILTKDAEPIEDQFEHQVYQVPAIVRNVDTFEKVTYTHSETLGGTIGRRYYHEDHTNTYRPISLAHEDERLWLENIEKDDRKELPPLWVSDDDTPAETPLDVISTNKALKDIKTYSQDVHDMLIATLITGEKILVLREDWEIEVHENSSGWKHVVERIQPLVDIIQEKTCDWHS